ncbi:hypothetical protein RhiirC2_669902, partial [Rhizophagus irregularis]
YAIFLYKYVLFNMLSFMFHLYTIFLYYLLYYFVFFNLSDIILYVLLIRFMYFAYNLSFVAYNYSF